jgi:hypothetical protein
VSRITSTRINDNTLLPMPTIHHLSRRLPMFLCNCSNIGMFPKIGYGIPAGTECCSKIRSTTWWITIKSDVVFLTEINKVIFMKIRMKFNLKRKNAIEKNILYNEFTWLTLGIREFKLKISNKWFTSKLLTPMART